MIKSKHIISYVLDFKMKLNIQIILIITGVLIGILSITGSESQNTEDLSRNLIPEDLVMAEGNSILPVSDISVPDPQVVRTINVIITAYSSTVWETDDTPYLTAAGTWVRDGIIANNYLPFGTKVRIPELYGDKVFVVEDRMSWKKGNYQIDIWFPCYVEAKNFGAKRTYVEILES